ncbi:MAG: toxin-antitoxin system YwqK family antitoxin, partial [Luteibaculum sp.]
MIPLLKHKLSLALALFLFTFLGSAQEYSSYDAVLFAKDKILDLRTGMVFTGRLQENYADGKTKAVSLVKNGKLDGTTKTFYPSGQTHFIINYSKGKLDGILTEYFSNGELKFQGEVQGQNRYGGNDLKGFLYAYYEGPIYKNKYKNKGRIQLITGNGLAPFFNAYLPPNEIEGYRVFENKLANYGIFIEDSRENLCPEV